MDLELAKVLGAGGIAGALLILIYLVGMRLVGAIDKLVTRIDSHEKSEFDHHAKVTEAIAEMRATVSVREAVQEAVDEISAVHDVPPNTLIQLKRKPTRGG